MVESFIIVLLQISADCDTGKILKIGQYLMKVFLVPFFSGHGVVPFIHGSQTSVIVSHKELSVAWTELETYMTSQNQWRIQDLPGGGGRRGSGQSPWWGSEGQGHPRNLICTVYCLYFGVLLFLQNITTTTNITGDSTDCCRGLCCVLHTFLDDMFAVSAVEP